VRSTAFRKEKREKKGRGGEKEERGALRG